MCLGSFDSNHLAFHFFFIPTNSFLPNEVNMINPKKTTLVEVTTPQTIALKLTSTTM
jgi:hypothetical protein